MALGIIDLQRNFIALAPGSQRPFHQTPQSAFKALLASSPAAASSTVAESKPTAAPQDIPVSSRTLPTLETDQGPLEIDIDAYFDPRTAPTYKTSPVHALPPLLIPSGENLKALSDHASAKFQSALQAYSIPQAPAQITFDNQGQMQIPEEYAHKQELKALFEQEPGLERELRTMNALASHTVAIMHSVAFSQEYQMANSKAAIDAVLAKYDYLFQNKRPEAQMALNFSADGLLQITADGVPLKF